MARYQYLARDASGNKVDGVIEAPSDVMVVTRLRKQNLFPINIYAAGQGEAAAKKESYAKKRGKVSLRELAIFTRQTAAMLDAGVSIIETLEDLSTQTVNRYFSQVLQNIKKDIQEGNNLSRALAKYPKVFSQLYVALVTSGEESGSLAEVIAEIATNLEDQLSLISKVKQAVSYPAVVLAFFIGVVAFVFLYLLPKFREVFNDFGSQLPKFTVVVMAISGFLVSALPFILILLLLFAVFVYFFNKTPIGREKIDGAKLKMPLIGQLMLKISLSRFAGSLATLLAGGVPIISALDIVARTTGNKVLEKTINKVREGVLKGSLVGTEMRKYRIFPVILTRMVVVGEETGKMEDMLKRTARFFRDEVDATLNVLDSIIEPLLIVSLGVIVGIVVLAIYLPIFNLAGAMR